MVLTGVRGHYVAIVGVRKGAICAAAQLDLDRVLGKVMGAVCVATHPRHTDTALTVAGGLEHRMCGRLLRHGGWMDALAVAVWFGCTLLSGMKLMLIAFVVARVAQVIYRVVWCIRCTAR